MTQTEKAAAAAQTDTSTQAVEPTQSSPVIPTIAPSHDSGILWVKGVIERPSHTLVQGWDKTNRRTVELLSYKDNPDPELNGIKRGDFIGYGTTTWEPREVTSMSPSGVETTTTKPGGSRQMALPVEQM